jgi:hypothetical protein
MVYFPQLVPLKVGNGPKSMQPESVIRLNESDAHCTLLGVQLQLSQERVSAPPV